MKYEKDIQGPFISERYNYEVNYYNTRNVAWKFLLKNNIKSYPLDLHTIATKNGWLIWSYSDYANFKHISKEELISENKDGLSIELPNNSYLILFNESNSKYRNRFTIAHEIGHILLHKLYMDKNKLEKEAQMFAARILMPLCLIHELNIETPDELSKICQVSIAAATHRLSRYKQIISRGMIYTNPLERELFNNLKDFIIKYKGTRPKQTLNK